MIESYEKNSLKKEDSKNNVFIQTGKSFFSNTDSKAKNNNNNNSNNDFTYQKNSNPFLIKEGFTKQNLFQNKNDSVIAQYDSNEKENNNKISKIIDLSPSKIEKNSNISSEINTSVVVNNCIKKGLINKSTESNFTKFHLELNNNNKANDTYNNKNENSDYSNININSNNINDQNNQNNQNSQNSKNNLLWNNFNSLYNNQNNSK